MARFIIHMSGQVDTGPEEGSDFKLLPIAPKRLAEVIPAVLRKLLEVAGEVGVTVGAFSVTIQQAPDAPGAGVDPSPDPASGTAPHKPAARVAASRPRPDRDPDRRPS
jgi:hypothetical protein